MRTKASCALCDSKLRVVMAASYELNLLEFLRLHKKHRSILTNPAIITEGSVVVCSSNGWDDAANDVTYLGKVLRAGEEVELVGKNGEAHPDGATGEVFVQQYNRATATPVESSLVLQLISFLTQ